MARIETDVIVVGSGPGGATLARELALKGREVILVERGRWHKWSVGRLSSLFTINKMVRSKEGGLMSRGITVGGSSVVYNGNAYDPPTWLASEVGIDLSEEVAETKSEIGIRPLPEDFCKGWSATQRLVEAAADLDIALTPQQKFINPEKCDPRCDDCMLGCRRGAKWTAREYIEEAKAHGARVLTRAMVERVIIEDGHAKGVKLRGPDGADEIRAEKVVLSAGGIGTPIILLHSGVEGAGEGFFIDPMNVVVAVGKYRGPDHEMTFSYASEEFVESEGYLVGNLGSRVLSGNKLMHLLSLRGLLRPHQLPRMMGVFTKIGDTPGGRIHADGTIEKPYSPEDQEKFRKGTETCKKILLKAGADPDSFTVAHNIGGHPGGTAAIGKVVGKDLQAYAAKNLYVCDASVFPRSPGRPPTLTIIALSKHMAKEI